MKTEREKQQHAALEALEDSLRFLEDAEYRVRQCHSIIRGLLPSYSAPPTVPEAVRRLPSEWRSEAEELDEHAEFAGTQTMAHRMLGRAAQMRISADELDRALAQIGEGRVPE